jgi:alkylation response protein AidB-like acyl-CoA dehydrogenase
MANFFTDNADLIFQYTHGFAWDELARLTELDYSLDGGPKNIGEARAFYDEVVSLVGDLSANKIAPQAAAIDREGAHLVKGEVTTPKAMAAIEKAFAEAGFFGMTVPRELGGSNTPLAVYFACTELVSRADVSLLTTLGFYGGTAMALLAYSINEGSAKPGAAGRMLESTRFDKEIREIVEGKNWGCMVLTEPDCGSDLGAIRTTGTLRDGKWYLNGNKIFITSGHGEYEIVLARTEPKSNEGLGLKGLSLFFVRRHLERGGKRVDNVRIDKVEEKLGHHGSATCSLVYEDSEAELIGERGQGFELMLLMMNGARIAVGFESIGLCQAAYNQASAYAELRRTMGKAIAEHELVAEMLMDMDTDIRGMRALAVECVNQQELAHKYEVLMRFRPPASEPERAQLRKRIAKLKRRARELTPLLKYIGGEKAVEIARKNMQIHGGAGYMAEVGAEKLLRDALVIPVYEGTSQIQALMVLKDHLLSVLRKPAAFAKGMSAASIGATTAKSATERSLNLARLEIYRSMTHLLSHIAGRKLRKDLGSALRQVPAHEWPRYLTQGFMRDWDMQVDFSYGLLHAERLTKMLVDVEIGGILFKQAAQFPERRIFAERHIRRMLPRVRYLSEEIRGGDTSVFEWLRERAAKLAGHAEAA